MNDEDDDDQNDRWLTLFCTYRSVLSEHTQHNKISDMMIRYTGVYCYFDTILILWNLKWIEVKEDNRKSTCCMSVLEYCDVAWCDR